MTSARTAGPFEMLLRYLSETGTGSWPGFRTAALEVLEQSTVTDIQGHSGAAHFVAARLAALGHLEFVRKGEWRWSIGPAALVQVESSREPCAVLAGQRSAGLVTRLAELVAGSPLLDMDISEQREGPQRVAVYAEALEDLARTAELLGIRWSPAFSRRLALLLPAVEPQLVHAVDRPAPKGWNIESFTGVVWRPADSDDADGLYRYERFTAEYRLKRGMQSLAVDRVTGIYAFLRDRNQQIVEYDPDKQELTVPAIAGLPPLAERAAVLSSGYLPDVVSENGRRQLVYHGVPPVVADPIRVSLAH